jgi:hypothetical protein
VAAHPEGKMRVLTAFLKVGGLEKNESPSGEDKAEILRKIPY